MKLIKAILILLSFAFVGVLGASANISVEEILSKTFRRVFKRCVYYIYEETDFTTIVDKSLIASNIPIISVEKNVSEGLITSLCNGYIIHTEVAENYERTATVTQLLTILKPWTQIIFINKPSMITAFQRAALNEKAIDVVVITVKTITEYCKFRNFTIGYDVTVTSLRKNKTWLTIREDGSKKINFPKRSLKTWIPKFSQPITVALFHCPPYVIIENNTFRGIEMLVISETLKNLPVEYLIPEENTEDGGLWALTVDMVGRGERDVTICSRWPVNSINKSIDITKSIRQVCVTFLVKKPSLLPDRLFVFLAFNFILLVPSLILFTICSIFLISTETLYNTLENNTNTDYGKPIMDVMRIFTGGSIVMTKMYELFTAKIIVFLWLLGCLLFATFYSAGITSNSAKPRITKIINTLDDMVSNKIPWKLTNDKYQEEFNTMDNPVYKNLAKLYIKGRRIADRTKNSAIFVKVMEQLFVNDIDELPVQDRKYYKVLSQCIGLYESVFFVKKDSPLTKLFDKTITRFVESGIADYLFKDVIEQLVGLGGHQSFFSNYVENRVYSNIGLSKLEGAFMLLGFGLVVSVLVFGLEIFVNKIKIPKHYFFPLEVNH